MALEDVRGDDVIDDIPEDVPGRRYDPKVEDAVRVLEAYLQEHRDVLYLRQLQVIFENRFYHWITAKAMRELVAAERVKREVRPLLGTDRVPR